MLFIPQNFLVQKYCPKRRLIKRHLVTDNTEKAVAKVALFTSSAEIHPGYFVSDIQKQF